MFALIKTQIYLHVAAAALLRHGEVESVFLVLTPCCTDVEVASGAMSTLAKRSLIFAQQSKRSDRRYIYKYIYIYIYIYIYTTVQKFGIT